MRRRCKMIGIVLSVMILGWVLTPKVLGVKAPSSVRVGLSTTEKVCDFKVISGSYSLLNGSDSSLLAFPEIQILWRATVTSDQQAIKLYSASSDGTLNEMGSFTSLLLIPKNSDNKSRFSYNNRVYRGTLSVSLNRNLSGMVVINELPLEHYLYGVVPREMSNLWPVEALKAQAVATRTYAIRNLNKHSAAGFNLCNGTCCQAYGGYSYEGETARQAVDSTKGQVVVDSRGSLIAALYHSNSGGYTEDNVNVNGYEYDYLKGKSDPYSLSNGLSNWCFKTSVVNDGSGQSVAEKIEALYPEFGTITGFTLGKYVSGRVYEVTIIDEKGKQLSLGGREFGQMFNPGFISSINKTSFMSNMFDIQTDADVNVINGYGQAFKYQGGIKSMAVRNTGVIMPFSTGGNSYQVLSATGTKTLSKSPQKAIFAGHGWGHGIGMSQWGAYGMALQGKSYQDILQFYYDGVQITGLE